MALLCAYAAAAKLRGEHSLFRRCGQRIGPQRIGVETVPSRGHLSADRAGTSVGSVVDAVVGAAVDAAVGAAVGAAVDTAVGVTV